MFGYAGTGKSTLAVEFTSPSTIFAAFTGKAAHVLRRKGIPARTIHSLIYHPRDRSRVRLEELRAEHEAVSKTEPLDEATIFMLKYEIKKEERSVKQPHFVLNVDSEVRTCELLVIDEVSMVGMEMGEDLLSFGRKVLVLGDPGQLPPVASGGFFTNAPPDRLLTEVHRQVAQSPVILLASDVREGRGVSLGRYGNSRVLLRGDLAPGVIYDNHDQILCGRNETRRTINRRVREHLACTSPYPEPGERVVCLRNNNDNGLLNGGTWTVDSCEELTGGPLLLKVTDGDQTIETLAHRGPFLGQEVSFFEARDADSFDFGYALTVHKSQGSQWPSVYVVDESAAFRGDAARWLYTAVTRAADRVTIAVSK